MYKFTNGKTEIILDCHNGIYEIKQDGANVESPYLTEEQRKNPILAVNTFVNEISSLLKTSVMIYQEDNGENPVMGCKVNMPCTECKAKGCNVPGSNCIFGGI